MADTDFSSYLEGRTLSICSDDSLDLHHRYVHVVVGVKRDDMSTFTLEKPAICLISGRWTPWQIYADYLEKLGAPLLDDASRIKSCLVYIKDREGFQDPHVVPFLNKPLYDWENWNDHNGPLPDGSRIALVV